MSNQQNCPKCHSIIPRHAPAGICPSCLMNAGLDIESSGELASTSGLTGGFLPPTPMELNQQFPELKIDQMIGRGGMGAVYKAKQPDLERNVAIKILPIEVGSNPTFTERFFREARALAKLSHQNIVTVFDFGQMENQYYFMMEYVDGTNLRNVIESGSIAPEEALEIVRQICDALQFAHSQGVVHRDIKPENILIDRKGNVKIADFGLAKLVDSEAPEASLTGTRQVMGTLRYMAPEQSKGTKLVDHRADIFSLGVIFYELLTGELPIGRFQPPSKKASTDARLDDVVLRALENEPSDRYQNASEVSQDIANITSGLGHTAKPPVKTPVVYEYPDNRISRKAIWGFVFFVMFLFAVVTSLFIFLTPQTVEFHEGQHVSNVNILPWYFIAFASLIFILPGLTSLVLTPLLGYQAIQDILEANGRLTGKFFAVFDVLIYPMMILNTLICVIAVNFPGNENIRFALAVGLLLSLVCDFFAIRWALGSFFEVASDGTSSHPRVLSTLPGMADSVGVSVDRDRFFLLLVCINIGIALLAYALAPRVDGVYEINNGLFGFVSYSITSPHYRYVRAIVIASLVISFGVFWAFAPKNKPDVEGPYPR